MNPLFEFRRLRYGTLAVLVLSLLLAVPPILAQQHEALLDSVDAIGITVSDMDRAVDFYSRVLTFEKVSDVEVAGEEYEHVTGVFGLRIRIVGMRLGDESIELTEYLAPKGRPIPADSRSNDRWFQHIAIIVSDMDKAYRLLRRNKVEHTSSGPQRLPDWNKNAAGVSAFYFKDPDGHPVEVLQFPPEKGLEKWHRPTDNSSWALIIPLSWFGTRMPASSSIAICWECASPERVKTTAPSRST
jgi:catechol 2,3-dioxygenase-like lactoylglutathione lyase family enzyme